MHGRITLSSQACRFLADPRATRLARLGLLAALVSLVAIPALAQAYPGEQLVAWARGTIVAPLCFLAIVIAIAAALIRPQLALVAVWVTVVSLFLMFVLSNGATITGHLQSSN